MDAASAKTESALISERSKVEAWTSGVLDFLHLGSTISLRGFLRAGSVTAECVHSNTETGIAVRASSVGDSKIRRNLGRLMVCA